LMEVSIPIWTNARCQDVFVHRIYSSTMCAGAPEGGRDSCQVRN
jgi:serine protease 56